MTALLPVKAAFDRLLDLASPLDIQKVSLVNAAGRWAAHDVPALRTQPSYDLSAMDGYAIRHCDMPGGWRVIGESAAGIPFSGALGASEAVRIFTGAKLPDGADAVLVQEEAVRDVDTLVLCGEGPLRPGHNIRKKGLDFCQGDTLIAKGAKITPAAIALAAIGGHADISVRRKARVAVLATGDELSSPGQSLSPDHIPESNGRMLTALIGNNAAQVVDLGIVADDAKALTALFKTVDADILVTTGGASVGDHDLVRPALMAAGGNIDFWRIALRPGKPMMAGKLRDTVMLGLPGNPVSAFVTATLFLHPLIAKMGGATDTTMRTYHAPLGEALPKNGERTDYLRARTVNGQVFSAAIQDSSMLATLARADCLIVRAPHARSCEIGEMVEIMSIA